MAAVTIATIKDAGKFSMFLTSFGRQEYGKVPRRRRNNTNLYVLDK
jgi:hypothetical protein